MHFRVFEADVSRLHAFLMLACQRGRMKGIDLVRIVDGNIQYVFCGELNKVNPDDQINV